MNIIGLYAAGIIYNSFGIDFESEVVSSVSSIFETFSTTIKYFRRCIGSSITVSDCRACIDYYWEESVAGGGVASFTGNTEGAEL